MARLGSKQPYEEYFVAFDFSELIGSASLASATVIVYDSTGATVTTALTVVANQTLSTSSVNVFICGGTTDQEYKVTCKVKTDAVPHEHYELDATLPVAEI